jgi:hypothetical protein
MDLFATHSEPTRRQELLNGLIGFVVLSAGILSLFKPGHIVGDLGDTRFNLFVLEHGKLDRRILRRAFEYALCGLASILVLLPLAIPYIHALGSVGGRDWSEVTGFLPRLESYVYAPTSFLWRTPHVTVLTFSPEEHRTPRKIR